MLKTFTVKNPQESSRSEETLNKNNKDEAIRQTSILTNGSRAEKNLIPTLQILPLQR